MLIKLMLRLMQLIASESQATCSKAYSKRGVPSDNVIHLKAGNQLVSARDSAEILASISRDS